jgi:hypothetical protein
MKGVLLLASAFAWIPMMATDAAGIQMDVIPSVRLDEGWQSNVFNAEDDEVSSFGTRLTPGLALRFTSTDKVMLKISGAYEKIWYHDSEAKDADYDTWFFRIDSTGGWKLTPNFSVRPSVYYVDTVNSSRRTQLVPSGDPVLPPVTIINHGDTSTEDIGGGVNISYLATPKWTIEVNGNYSEQRFSDNTSESGLTNSTSTGGNASVSYLLSPRTTLGIIVGGSHQTYENNTDLNTSNPDSNLLAGGILLGYQFSPTIRFDATMGVAQIRQEEAPGIPEQKESSPSGKFNIAYTLETFTANAFGSYVYSGGSGFGEATEQWTTGLAFSGRFTREWSWNLSGAYQVSQSAFETDVVDSKTINSAAGLSYKPWEWGSLELTGNLGRQTSDGQFGSDLNYYSALLGFTIEKPYKIF